MRARRAEANIYFSGQHRIYADDQSCRLDGVSDRLPPASTAAYCCVWTDDTYVGKCQH